MVQPQHHHPLTIYCYKSLKKLVHGTKLNKLVDIKTLSGYSTTTTITSKILSLQHKIFYLRNLT